MECNDCYKGVKMCYNRPGFGTPEEFEAIIDAGLAHKLRIDYWCGRDDVTPEQFKQLPAFAQKYILENLNPFKEDVEMLTGGTDEDENFRAPYIISRKFPCKFLEDNRCTLHDKGLKPEQCRESCCEDSKNQLKKNIHYAFLWSSLEGKRVVQKFKDIMGI